MAAAPRKRKTVPKAAEIPPPLPARKAPMWLQSVAVFVAGLGLGVLMLGPGARWASEGFNSSSGGADLPPPAFGGLPVLSAGSLRASSSASSPGAFPLTVSSASSMLAASSSVPASAQPNGGAGSSSFEAMLRSRMDYQQVARGVIGGQDKAGYLVALTQAQKDKLWGDMTARGAAMPAAAVNLDGRMLVAVFAGERPDASYALEISHVVMTEKDIRLFVLETHGGANCVQQFTPVTPYELVTIDRIDLPLVVVREETAIDCE